MAYRAKGASIRTIQSLRPAPTFRCLHTPTVAFPQSQSPRAQHRGYATTTSPEKWTPQTLTEKVVQRYAVGLPPGKLFRSGDYISIEPATILTHDNSFPVMTKFMSIGATKVHRPSQLVMALDHDVSNKSEVMVEEGHAWPGTMAVASDSHGTHYGGVGCLGTPVVRTDACSICATDRTWCNVPPIARVRLTGTLPQGVTGKDVIVALCGIFKSDVLKPHPDAVYAKQLYLNLSTLSPYVSGPDTVKVATPLHELAPQKIKVDRAYIVSCTNSRASDIRAAAKVFRDAADANGGVVPKIAGSILVEAGAQPLMAGCGPCIGLGTGLLEPGEVDISASNRNFKGRMGSRDAKAYLSSPEAVAASALSGIITGPGIYQVPKDWTGVDAGYGTGLPPTTETELSGLVQQLDSFIDRVESAVTSAEDNNAAATEILPGFPSRISGESSSATPTTSTRTPSTRASSPTKTTIAKPHDIIVSGFNFGCGSSREQSATAILARDIPLVVAASFGNVFSRNSINNALMGLEIPRLVERLCARFPSTGPAEGRVLTRRTGWTLTWDVRRSLVEVTEGPGGETWTEKVGELPANVQEIIAAEGLEAWVKAELAKAE
ncbi:hypothetical protein CHGG_07330 [Chaetomium globosum CBS 148.51]|uniref:Homoaconitate hydratase n=1 Tax=Chaetomium globosum (strain ATCC 6205 / CBS 148.51 / DSM 1962 / NBRC 6347 / NRRL 1970) TaxID=306901 RepID=Q2GXH4_CHAGB|nr:uncharacterized protein CHGG_07330 [Chaetomium globosum CBS 148.51]EAQ86077.1 hypothetical protein CHGG_07330 [Chaetomium globosum CBS 148.51]